MNTFVQFLLLLNSDPKFEVQQALVAELVDALDSKSSDSNIVGVRVPPGALNIIERELKVYSAATPFPNE